MPTTCSAIYLSPHLDDGVLSCGGQIAARVRRGESVRIATLAAGDPPGELLPLARELHAAWKLGDEACAARRAEDRRACAWLGAEGQYEAVPEAMYRRHPATGAPLYPTLQAVFGPPHPADSAAELWIAALRRLPPAECVVAPLGVGGHVDHVLVRRAAEAVFGAALLYYEEYPYAGRFWAVGKTVWPPWRWRARTIPLAPEDFRARCEAVAAYASQTAMLFAGAGNLESRLARYVRRAGGERLWTKRPRESFFHCT
jgi:LmbE family N-acetylglucosaminyl deacetylase